MNLTDLRKFTPLERFAYWITERELIRKRKEAGKPMPWTQDWILQKYRFCNVHREDDLVTRWIRENWRAPNANDPLLWFAMLVARYINWPPTLGIMKYPTPWARTKAANTIALKHWEKAGNKVFTGAYIVSTNGAPMNKLDYVLELFERSSAYLIKAKTLAETYEQLIKINGVGSFMAAQIIADLKQEGPLKNAPDWMDWCAPGPGSQRGLNRVRSGYLDQKWPIALFIGALFPLRQKLSDMGNIGGDFCLQDLQNCLCEFDKYERVLYDQGRPRSLYRPQQQPLF